MLPAQLSASMQAYSSAVWVALGLTLAETGSPGKVWLNPLAPNNAIARYSQMAFVMRMLTQQKAKVAPVPDFARMTCWKQRCPRA
jgi:hypothetical protein